MLLCEDGGGAEEGGLFAAGDALEGGADGDFGFPESYVAADEAIHGVGGLEVVLGVLDGLFLIGGFGVVETLLELEHPAGVGGVGVALLVLALGLDAEEAGGVVEDGFLGLLAVFLPGGVAEFVEVRGFAADSDVFPDEVGLFEGDGEDGAVLVFDLEFLAFVFLGDAFEFPDAVFVVDDEVAFFDVVEGGAGAHDACFLDGGAAGGSGGAVAAEEFAGG